MAFAWPRPSPGFPDNTVPAGQTVTVDAASGTQTLAFLGAATQGDGSGVVTLNYSDGSTSQYWLGFSDWTLGGGSGSGTPAYGNQVAASTTYRDCAGCSGGQDAVTTYMFDAQRRLKRDRDAHLRGRHWLTLPGQAPAVLARRALVTLSPCVPR